MSHSTKKLDLKGRGDEDLTAIAPTENSGTCICSRAIRSDNTSGVPGVDWLTGKRRWRATICFKGKRRYLGCYEKFEDAVRARKQAEKNLSELFSDTRSEKNPRNEVQDIEKACPPLGRSRCARRLDLTGQRFGRLTVIAPSEKIGAMTAWRCRCDCGKETVVTTGHLRSGWTASCGCKPKGTFVDGTFVELIRSTTVRSNNSSGVTGVEWMPQTNRWKAVIFFKGKRHYLGCYEKFEDAVKARKQAEKELFEPFLREFAQEEETASSESCNDKT